MAREAQEPDVARVVPLGLVASLGYRVVEVMRPRFAQRMPAFLAFVFALVPYFADEELRLGSVLLNPFLRPFSDLRYRLRIFFRSYGNREFQSVLPSFFRTGTRLWKRHMGFRFRRRNYSGFCLGTDEAVGIPFRTSGMLSRPLSREDVEDFDRPVYGRSYGHGIGDSFADGRFLVLGFLQTDGFRLLRFGFRADFFALDFEFALGLDVLPSDFRLGRFVVLFGFVAFRCFATSAGRKEDDERRGQ